MGSSMRGTSVLCAEGTTLGTKAGCGSGQSLNAAGCDEKILLEDDTSSTSELLLLLPPVGGDGGGVRTGSIDAALGRMGAPFGRVPTLINLCTIDAALGMDRERDRNVV